MVTSKILGPNGEPYVVGRASGGGGSTLNDYLKTLVYDGRQTPTARAREPFKNHAWVFAAAWTAATTASQAPFQVFTETVQQMEYRRKSAGRSTGWLGHAGRQRRAVQRYMTKSPYKRMVESNLEENPDHPIMDLLLHPNELIEGSALFHVTITWLRVAGEAFWVCQGKDGEWIGPGEIPAMVWPVSPHAMNPYLVNGVLMGWDFAAPEWMPGGKSFGRLRIPPWAVYQFKFPNPDNLMRGMSPISAAATGIETDMMISNYNRAVIENGGDPGGVLMYDADLSQKERKEILTEWEQTHKGPDNAKKTRILSHGFTYLPISMNPKDMEYIEQKKWDRDEILAVMNTPRSIVGQTEYVNYATHQGERKNFWENGLIPTLLIIETTLDSRLFMSLPDSTMGMFDLRQVEALRAGLQEKVTVAVQLTGEALHMDPKTAFRTVGLEVDHYVGCDKALVPAMGLATVESVLATAAMPTVDPATGLPTLPTAQTETPKPGADVPSNGEQQPATGLPTLGEQPGPPNASPAGNSTALPQLKVAKPSPKERWAKFIKVQTSLEQPFGSAYRSWVLSERNEVLAAFDKETSGFKSRLVRVPVNFNFTKILPDLNGSKKKLRGKVRPQYTKQLMKTYDFSQADFGGIPIFELDDPKIQEFFTKKELRLTNSTPATIRKNLERELREGIAEGDSIAMLRGRIAQVYDISASSSKTLQIARTETTGFMNGARDVMFEAQGFTSEIWVTANDENVRDSHVQFGDAGEKPRGFNYLTLVGKKGSLRYPGDTDAPAEEIINCRCMKVPTK